VRASSLPRLRARSAFAAADQGCRPRRRRLAALRFRACADHAHRSRRRGERPERGRRRDLRERGVGDALRARRALRVRSGRSLFLGADVAKGLLVAFARLPHPPAGHRGRRDASTGSEVIPLCLARGPWGDGRCEVRPEPPAQRPIVNRGGGRVKERRLAARVGTASPHAFGRGRCRFRNDGYLRGGAMGGRLVPCGACSRHVRCSEVACPFCGGAVSMAPIPSREPFRRLAAAAAVVALTGCATGGSSLPPYGAPPFVEDDASIGPSNNNGVTCKTSAGCLPGQVCCGAVNMTTSCQTGPCPSTALGPLQLCGIAAECLRTGDTCGPLTADPMVMVCNAPSGDDGGLSSDASSGPDGGNDGPSSDGDMSDTGTPDAPTTPGD